MKIFRIKDRNTELFSTGGSYAPKFTKRGKIWQTEQAVSAHLHQYIKKASTYYNTPESNNIPENWILIIYDFDANTEMEVSAKEWKQRRIECKTTKK